MLNDTISGNRATGDPSFGGIQAGLSDVYCNNVTVANNSAASGAGGIDANIIDLIIIIGPGRGHVHKPRDQHFVIANSIIADNDSSGNLDCLYGLDQPPIESAGYNDVGDSCILGGHDDSNIYTDPSLGPLQNNGGETDTQALLPGSPAIGAGNPAKPNGDGRDHHCVASDQIGTPRPEGDCDIGAYQVPQ
jgi:hypothetical protein